MRRRRTLSCLLLAIGSLVRASTLVCADETVGPLDVEQAIDLALRQHPAIRASSATVDVRRAQVAGARAAYLPNLELSVQLSGATGNVLRGVNLPMPEIPTVSGPPTGRDWSNAALGSVVGVGLEWDAIGLARQMAQVDAALADEGQSRAAVDVARLTVAYGAADQLIDVLSREQAVAAARATVERMRVFAAIVNTLVAKGLRPGVDFSRASAELAVASTILIRAEQAEAESRAALARALGVAGRPVRVVAGRLLEPPRAPSPPPDSPAPKRPELVEADAAIKASRARRRAATLDYLPRLEVVGAVWMHGSGLTSGTLPPSPGAGVVPDTPNWATGLVLSWPALATVAVRARVRAETAQVTVAQARRADVAQAVQTQIDSARATLDASRRIAENTPIAVGAARDAETQATARYRSGLATVDAVAESLRLLAQAELDDAVARLNVRRAELLLARAVGDLSPFLDGLRGGR